MSGVNFQRAFCRTTGVSSCYTCFRRVSGPERIKNVRLFSWEFKTDLTRNRLCTRRRTGKIQVTPDNTTTEDYRPRSIEIRVSEVRRRISRRTVTGRTTKSCASSFSLGLFLTRPHESFSFFFFILRRRPWTFIAKLYTDG